MRTAHLSIEQKIGVNLDGILFDTEIVLQLSLVTIELLVEGLCLPEVIVQHLEGVQDVGHLGDQLSLGGITLFLQVGFLSPIIDQTYLCIWGWMLALLVLSSKNTFSLENLFFFKERSGRPT